MDPARPASTVTLAQGRITDAAGHGCRGKCKGVRGMADSPALFGRDGTGRKLMFCPCCGTELRAATRIEYAGQGTDPLNLKPETKAAGSRLMVDDLCAYNVWWIAEVRAR